MKIENDCKLVFRLKSRESYFKLLQQALWKNYLECQKIEPDVQPQTEEDVTQKSIEMEYKIFSGTTVITIYRRKMALLTSQIKKETDKFNLYVPETNMELPEATPEEDRPLPGGFVKASDLVFATDIEASIPSKTEIPVTSIDTPPVEESLLVKKRVSRLTTSESSPQRTIQPTSKSTNNDSDLIAKAKEIEARLSSQINFMSKSTGTEASAKKNKLTSDLFGDSQSSSESSRTSKQSSKTSSKVSSFKSSKRSLDRQTSLDRFFTAKKQRLDSQPESMSTIPEVDKESNNLTVKTEVVKKDKQDRSPDKKAETKTERPKSSQKSSRDDKLKTPVKAPKTESSPNSSAKKTGSSHKSSNSKSSISPDKSKTSPDKTKQNIADLVVRCLMPLYAAKQIGSRDLFKSLARHLSHVIRSSTPPLTGNLIIQ